MKTETRHSRIELSDTTMFCPRCGQLERVGRIGVRTAIDKTPGVDGDGRECELMLPTINEDSIVLRPGRYGEFMHPAYWEKCHPLFSARCVADDTEMIAIDTAMAPLVNILDANGVYVKDVSAGDSRRGERAYIKFFRTIPFWLWGVWRNLTISNENPGYGLELADNASTVVITTGWPANEDLLARMQTALYTLLSGKGSTGLPLLEDYGMLVTAILPNMYDMCIADTEDDVKANVDSLVDLIGIPGDPYPAQYHFPSVYKKEFTTLSCWLDQIESVVWHVWTRDEKDHPENVSAYEAFKEIINYCSPECYESNLQRDELGRKFIPKHRELQLDLRDCSALRNREVTAEYMAELVSEYESRNEWATILPYDFSTKPEAERTKWERVLDQLMAYVAD